MDKYPAIKITSSTFKFIANVDIFTASFIKDNDLFPMSDDMSEAAREELNAKGVHRGGLMANMRECAMIPRTNWLKRL
jgi:hypothetical protein